jgi:hypothetical protein
MNSILWKVAIDDVGQAFIGEMVVEFSLRGRGIRFVEAEWEGSDARGRFAGIGEAMLFGGIKRFEEFECVI